MLHNPKATEQSTEFLPYSKELREAALNQPTHTLPNGMVQPMGSSQLRREWYRLEEQKSADLQKRIEAAKAKKLTPAEEKLQAYKNCLSPERLAHPGHQQNIAKLQAEVDEEKRLKAFRATDDYKYFTDRVSKMKQVLPSHLHNEIDLRMVAYENENIDKDGLMSEFSGIIHEFAKSESEKLKTQGDEALSASTSFREKSDAYNQAVEKYKQDMAALEAKADAM